MSDFERFVASDERAREVLVHFAGTVEFHLIFEVMRYCYLSGAADVYRRLRDDKVP